MKCKYFKYAVGTCIRIYVVKGTLMMNSDFAKTFVSKSERDDAESQLRAFSFKKNATTSSNF